VALELISSILFLYTSERMSDVMSQPRESKSEVRKRETPPWPPRRMWGLEFDFILWRPV
jgi:hypothetical protein